VKKSRTKSYKSYKSVSVILKYVSPAQQDVAYQNKCWTMISQTPWTGIHRCEPGRLYRNGQPEQQLDSVWSWIDRPLDMTETEANDEFLKLLTRAVDVMRPDCSTTVSYSAGVDSNIIMNLLGNCDLLSIDIVGKDPVVTQAAKFLTSAELDRLRTISVDPEQWAQCYQDLIKHTQMPGHWSHVGKWLVAKHSASPVIFTGLAADELFGGYSVYQTIDYTHDQSHSPYSQHDHENIWDRCISSYQGDARSATLLMDYWYQVVGVDTPGLDQAGGAWGKETRNPFMDRTLMQFALILPWHLRVGAVT
jgi:asparagine synthetase B (glutamine-hydrolysing)